MSVVAVAEAARPVPARPVPASSPPALPAPPSPLDGRPERTGNVAPGALWLSPALPGAPATAVSVTGRRGRHRGGPALELVRIALLTLSGLTLSLTLSLVLGSGLEHRAAQAAAFDRFRQELALGTAPIGPVGSDHRLLPLGTPMALLEIPSLGVKEIVGEGTTASALADGPGHLRSTVFPGGTGTSVVFGRAAAYGGPFGRIGTLRAGNRIRVVTGVGTSTFRVVDVRRAHQPVPPLRAGMARLTLATATGSSYLPTGVVWVDADRTGPPLPAYEPAVHAVPADERPLAVETATLWELALWLALLAGVLGLAVRTWHRRGHAQAWVTFSAPVAVVGYLVAGHAALLLPNLL